MTRTLPTVTRHDNGNGTYRYRIDALPDFAIDASRVLYTHASAAPSGDDDWVVNFHKTESAALRASTRAGYRLLVIASS